MQSGRADCIAFDRAKEFMQDSHAIVPHLGPLWCNGQERLQAAAVQARYWVSIAVFQHKLLQGLGVELSCNHMHLTRQAHERWHGMKSQRSDLSRTAVGPHA